jgi:hypothetical protein
MASEVSGACAHLLSLQPEVSTTSTRDQPSCKGCLTHSHLPNSWHPMIELKIANRDGPSVSWLQGCR